MKIPFLRRVMLMGAILVFTVAGFRSARADDPFRIAVSGPPPSKEAPGPQWKMPDGSPYVWIKGHYEWGGGSWVWVNGVYALPPRHGVHWIRGHYDDGYWYPGHWDN